MVAKRPVFIFKIKKQLLFPDANKHRFLKCKKKTDMSVFLVIENEFDNFDKLLQLGNSNRIDRKKIPTYIDMLGHFFI